MKIYGGVELFLLAFLNSTLDGDELQNLAILPLEKETLVFIGWEADCARQPVWML
jgi:hypothetical protein